jgi:tRNA threonylcarbamoyladenosine biosynthesis protein TsaB
VSACPGPIAIAIETSRRRGSVAVQVGGTLHEQLLAGGGHASDLLPALEGLLTESGVARAVPLPIEAVVVGTGPGSFTGLRVGIATAQALARAARAPILGLCSFEALCWRLLEPGETGTVVLDARAGRFYHARYRRSASDLEVCSAPRALDPQELRGALRLPGPLLAEPGLEQVLELDPGARARLRSDEVPCAGALLVLGRARLACGTSQAPESIEPLYLQEFRTPPPGAPHGR